MKNLILILCILLNFSASAKPLKRKPAQIGQTLIVSTVHGDLFSQFTLENKNDQVFRIAFDQNNGNLKTRQLTRDDFNFIIEEYKKLPSGKATGDCYRARINVVHLMNGIPVQNKTSCFGMGTVTEPAYARFSQILINSL